VTETDEVQAALDEVRALTGVERVDLPELVVLGAREKVARLRAQRGADEARKRRLLERIRTGHTGTDLSAAEEVRRSGWTR